MLRNKVIVVTGASRGIGRDISRALAAEGAQLALIARGQADLDRLARELLESFPASRVCTYSCDMAQSASVQSTVGDIVKDFGWIDGCISNAGYAHPQYFDQTPVEEFEKQIQINYLGAVYLIKACRPHMRRGSFIAMTSSVLGYMGCFGYSSYAPTKFAILGLAESLRQELDFDGIKVSVLCPPDTQTPGYEAENQTKPFETRRLSEGMRVLSSEKVAAIFLKGLKRGRFMINCSFESEMIYRVKHMIPDVYHKVLMLQLKRIRWQHQNN